MRIALVRPDEPGRQPFGIAEPAAWLSAAGIALDRAAPDLPVELGNPIPHHSEPWFCGAEPTSTQLQAL